MREKDFVLLGAIGMLLLLAPLAEAQVYPVSYTHLTLPTIYSV